MVHTRVQAGPAALNLHCEHPDQASHLEPH
jgi:hypothetical protein